MTGAELSSTVSSPPPESDSVSVKSMAVSVNSCNIESADSPSTLTVVLVDRPVDGFFGGQGRFDFPVENETQLFDRFEVKRVGDQNGQGRRLLLLERQHRVFSSDRFGHPIR